MNHELMLTYVYKWVESMKDAHACPEHKVICFCNDHYHAHVSFYENLNIIELSIQDKKTEENLFYLHFELNDIKTARNNILSFFEFLKGEITIHQDVEINVAPMKVLISCIAGFTSSYFASMMQQVFCDHEQNVQVDAMSIYNIDDVKEDYDVILIAPQISYLYPQLKEKYGQKVMMIEAIDFATGNVQNTIHKIIA